MRPLSFLPAMKACLPLACFVIASCAAWPAGGGPTRTLFGRIVSTPAVEIWLGHVTGGGMLYEVAPEQSPRTLIGLMFPHDPASQCPWNGRPREQLFRIDYGVAGDRSVYGFEDRNTALPRHLRTNLFVLRCALAGAP